MYFDVDDKNFEPKHFVILNFYGTDTCFAWNEDEFVYFSYVYEKTMEKLRVYKAPARIKDFREFNERVYILCFPSGIYKLTDNIEFGTLSKAGIELGSGFNQVFTPNNEVLIVEDKKTKISKKLFTISCASEIHVLPLSLDKVDKGLHKVLISDTSNQINNLCIISHNKKLFKMLGQTIQIIYSCDYVIKNIKPIEKCGKIIGVVLQTDTKVAIFMNAVENNFKYDKVFLGVIPEILCAFVDTTVENVLILIYSNDKKTYYSKTVLSKESAQEIICENKSYTSFMIYKSNYVIYMNSSKELLQTETKQLGNMFDHKSNDYVKLEINMLKGLERTIETICDKTVDLEKLKIQLMEKEDKLKRINVFVNKQRLKYCPQNCVTRILNQIFLISNYKTSLLENSVAVAMLKSREKASFSMKKVRDYDTVIEMPICKSNLSAKLYTTMDLITYKNDNGVWCLLKNYIQDPLPNKSSKILLALDKRNLVKYKLIVLKNLMKRNNVSMEDLANIKREIRQEINFEEHFNARTEKCEVTQQS